MSFKLFVYYSAISGGWAAFLAWFLGRVLAPAAAEPEVRAVVQGLILGLLVALSVGLVDAFWNVSSRQTVQLGVRVLAPVAVGCIGGVVGPLIAQFLAQQLPDLIMLWVIFGWVLTGLVIGASVGAYDWLIRLVRKENTGGALRKIRNGLVGGALGGLVGGILLTGLNLLFRGSGSLLSPSAIGYVALGLFIGLLIGLVQVILKEAWIKVESGFRPGREIMLTKPEITIGRAESCDIGLFGDNAIERMHARIVQEGNQYLLSDPGSPAGTYVNDAKISQPVVLQSGDLIRVGNSVLRFGERQKKPSG